MLKGPRLQKSQNPYKKDTYPKVQAENVYELKHSNKQLHFLNIERHSWQGATISNDDIFDWSAAINFSAFYFPYHIFSILNGTVGKVPQSAMMTSLTGVLPSTLVPSIFLTTSSPLITFPNTTCLPSSHEVFTVVMKN